MLVFNFGANKGSLEYLALDSNIRGPLCEPLEGVKFPR